MTELRGRGRAAPTGEPLLVWVLYALVGAAIFATYARTPIGELYHVSGSGPGAAAGRVLVFLNWSTALAALGTLIFAADRGGRGTRLAAVFAALLCAVIFWPGVVAQADLNAKWPNAVAGTGVAIALVLSVRGARPIAVAVWTRADRWRLALAVVLTFVSLPLIVATIGFNIGSIPALASLFYGPEMWAPLGQARLHQAVHPGEHHGLDGLLLALSALLLSRRIGAVNGPRFRQAARLYCAAILPYGIANIVNDTWYEQLVKRGALDWSFPSMILPRPSLAWALLLISVVVLYRFVFRDTEGTADVAVSPAWALVLAPPLALGLAVGTTSDATVSQLTPLATLGDRTLLFSSGNSGSHLYKVHGDGNGLARLSHGRNTVVAPVWSPAGGMVAFQSNRDGNHEIYVMNADMTGLRNITSNPAADGEPAWSPDGRRIAFVSNRSGNQDVYVVNADGSGLRRLTRDDHVDEWPAWSPDGRSIAFDSDRTGNFDLYIVRSDGQAPAQQLTAGDADDRYPRLFPDGKELVFESDRSGRIALHTIAPVSPRGSIRTLTEGHGDDFGPAVSPDGRWVAFLSDRDGNDQLYVIRRDGRGLGRLTTGMADRGGPAWSS